MITAIRPTVAVARIATRAFSAGPVVLRESTKKAILERNGIPSPPRGPKSSYAFFVAEQFSQNAEDFRSPEGTKFDIADTSSKVSEAWRALSDSAKESYAKQAAADRADYDKAFDEWYAGLAPGELKEAEGLLGKKIRIPGGKRGRGSTEAAGKRPLSAFFLYMKEYREKNTGVGSVTEVSKAAGEAWKALADDAKATYKTQADKLKAEYQKAKDSL